MPIETNDNPYPCPSKLDDLKSIIGWGVVVLLIEHVLLCYMNHFSDAGYFSMSVNCDSGIIELVALSQIDVRQTRNREFPAVFA
ncbi:hypothetical protein WT83_16375 [Burkholderia territorii]|uniref:Uncharacterized protein n=1 Tax=Burkholderia territorii TaxID=1503055 RepID=A0A108ENG9_9BURK|nr:hypothetical protein WT83_16375 [Burkholderia territorii]